MSPSLLRFPARAFLAMVTAIALTVASASAAVGGFSATLSNDQQIAAGLATLTGDQRAALDRLVAAELARVRSNADEALTGTFLSRRSDEELALAGLNQLTPQQLTKLNEYAAAALAARPQPRERPRLKDSDVISAKRRPEIHGEVTVAYGFGRGGREMLAGSLFVNYYDPESRIGIGVEISQFEGDGFWGGYPGYGYGYGFDPIGYGYGYGYGYGSDWGYRYDNWDYAWPVDRYTWRAPFYRDVHYRDTFANRGPTAFLNTDGWGNRSDWSHGKGRR